MADMKKVYDDLIIISLLSKPALRTIADLPTVALIIDEFAISMPRSRKIELVAKQPTIKEWCESIFRGIKNNFKMILSEMENFNYKHGIRNNYRTRAIITRGLYTFYSLFDV